jgi:hypothetical protein
MRLGRNRKKEIIPSVMPVLDHVQDDGSGIQVAKIM